MKKKLRIIFTLALLCIMTSCGVPSAEDQTTDHGDMADTKTVQPTHTPSAAPDLIVPTPDVTTPVHDVTVPDGDEIIDDVRDTANDLIDDVQNGIDDLTSPNSNTNPENGAR